MTPAMANIVKTVSNVLFHDVDICIWFGWWSRVSLSPSKI